MRRTFPSPKAFPLSHLARRAFPLSHLAARRYPSATFLTFSHFFDHILFFYILG